MTQHGEHDEREEDVQQEEPLSLLEEQEGKGYGADPGERDEAFEQESDDA